MLFPRRINWLRPTGAILAKAAIATLDRGGKTGRQKFAKCWLGLNLEARVAERLAASAAARSRR